MLSRNWSLDSQIRFESNYRLFNQDRLSRARGNTFFWRQAPPVYVHGVSLYFLHGIVNASTIIIFCQDSRENAAFLAFVAAPSFPRRVLTQVPLCRQSPPAEQRGISSEPDDHHQCHHHCPGGLGYWFSYKNPDEGVYLNALIREITVEHPENVGSLSEE